MNERDFRGRVRRLQDAIDAELKRRGIDKYQSESTNRYIDIDDYEDIIDAEFIEMEPVHVRMTRQAEAVDQIRVKLLLLIAAAMLCGVLLGVLI